MERSLSCKQVTEIILWFVIHCRIFVVPDLFSDEQMKSHINNLRVIFVWKDHSPASECQTLVILWFAVAQRLRTEILPRPENLTRKFKFKILDVNVQGLSGQPLTTIRKYAQMY